jgi:acetyltransferase-like isoleucine patch superfamily enzyme
MSRTHRSFRIRARSALFLLPAWFSPASALRVAFHRIRGARIAKSAEIGYFVIIDNLYPDKVIVDEGATISARSTVLAHDEAKAYTGRGEEVVKETRIGREAFVGVHCVILPGVTIGPRAIVGAGSVVAKDVPPGAVVAGVPAHLLDSSAPQRAIP